MNISNGVYKTIRMNWDAFTFPIAEGTPVSVGGVEANDSGAFGIIPQNVLERPLIPDHYILVSGAVSDFEYDLSAEALGALSDIHFIDLPNASSGGLPEVTAEDNGDVLTVVDGKWSKAAPSGGGIVYIEEIYDETLENYKLPLTYKELKTAVEAGTFFFLTTVDDWESEKEKVFRRMKSLFFDGVNGVVFEGNAGQDLAFVAVTENDYLIFNNTPS